MVNKAEGQALRAIRERVGVKAIDVVTVLKKSPTWLSLKERGYQPIRPEDVEAVQKAVEFVCQVRSKS